jgi:hypothetical protein
MQKRYIMGATAAVISAGLMVEMQVGSTALDQIEILVDEPAGGVAVSAGRPARDPAPAPLRPPAVEMAAVSAPAGAPPADAAPLEEALLADPVEIDDVEMLLAYRSPWSDQPAGDERQAWGRSGAAGQCCRLGPTWSAMTATAKRWPARSTPGAAMMRWRWH